MSTQQMNWPRARKKPGRSSDTLNGRTKKQRFDPDSEYVQRSVDAYLAGGGEITVLVAGKDYEMFNDYYTGISEIYGYI